MARVEVKPNILQWVVSRTGNFDVLMKKFPKLPEWINNESQPTLKQLEKLSKATATPLGYFFLSDPPEEQLNIPHHRTLNDQFTNRPSPNLIDTVDTMERRQQWMREYLINLGHEQLNYVGSAKISDDPKITAQDIRKTLGLGKGWASERGTWQDALRLLINKIEEIGILVVINGIVGNNTHRKLDVSEFRGFVLIDEYAPLIFVNGADGKAAQMFTLAHELAHIWLGASAAFDLTNLQPANAKIEVVCNKIAAEFLVPTDELYVFWQQVKGFDDCFQQIARNFKVSEIVAARRALDLKLITKKKFFDFYNSYLERLRNNENESSGGNFYATQNLRIGRRFAEAVIRATKEGTLLYREAYQLTGLNGKTFSTFAESIYLRRELGVYWTLQIELIFYFLCAFLFYKHLLHRVEIVKRGLYLFVLLALVLAIVRYITYIKLPVALPLALAVMFFGILWNKLIFKEIKNPKEVTTPLFVFIVFLIPTCILAYGSDYGYGETWYRYTLTYLGIAEKVSFFKF